MQNVVSVINSYIKLANRSGAFPLDTQSTRSDCFGALAPLAVLCLFAVDVKPV